eukprot:scaffold638_cov168-Amphora_coffeaeformis.AAC.36
MVVVYTYARAHMYTGSANETATINHKRNTSFFYGHRRHLDVRRGTKRGRQQDDRLFVGGGWSPLVSLLSSPFRPCGSVHYPSPAAAFSPPESCGSQKMNGVWSSVRATNNSALSSQ